MLCSPVTAREQSTSEERKKGWERGNEERVETR